MKANQSSQIEPAKIIRFPGTLPDRPGCAAAIGKFDGVHRGHRRILEALSGDAARGEPELERVVISFYPHPLQILRGNEGAPPALTSLRQKVALLGECGVGYLYLVHFTRAFSQLSARAFIEDILVKTLNVRRLVIGADARIGKGREGDAAFITAAMQSLGREAVQVGLLREGEAPISSAAIRALLAEGDVRGAGGLLGRPYTVDSIVVRGDGRDATIGIPTANLKSSGQIRPKPGVYATLARLEGRLYPSVTNIGVRPTFSGQEIRTETHLLDYQGPNFYGQRLEVSFIGRLRDEKRFSGVQELIAQIQADIAEGRRILATEGR